MNSLPVNKVFYNKHVTVALLPKFQGLKHQNQYQYWLITCGIGIETIKHIISIISNRYCMMYLAPQNKVRLSALADI